MQVRATFGWYKGKGAVLVTTNKWLAKQEVEVPREITQDEWYDGEGKLIICEDTLRFYNKEMGIWEEMDFIDTKFLEQHGIKKIMTLKTFLAGINYKMD